MSARKKTGGSSGRGPSSRRKTRPRQRQLLSGVLRLSAGGQGTVETAEGMLRVPARHVHEAMSGDVVEVKRLGGDRIGGLPAASVVSVLARGTTTFVARLEREPGLGVGVLVPLDARLGHDFVLSSDPSTTMVVGDRSSCAVVARVLEYPTRQAAGVAGVERVVDDLGEGQLATESIIASHGLRTEFGPDAVAQADSLDVGVEEALRDPLRRDLRGLLVVTIDPADARDFDDALSLEVDADGNRVLGVHIADVSHYVGWHDAIDVEARSRGTSVYLADRVLPMLPERLSNDICSLVPGSDRLAMSVELTLDAMGRVISSRMGPSVIRSRARLTYDEVDAALEDSNALLGAVGDEGLSSRIADLVSSLDEVRAQRLELRMQRGALELESTESRVVLDDDSSPTGVRIRSRTRATELVEEAMLAANEAVARRLDTEGAPCVYRVHEEPRADALAGLVGLVQPMLHLDPMLRAAILAGDGRALGTLVSEVADEDRRIVVSSLVLRAMKRAEYDPRDKGHYGLATSTYCHFTSPIRRYPDLVVHRCLKALISGSARGEWRRAIREELPFICKDSSRAERVAAEAAAQSQDARIAEYLGGRLGERFSGIVMSVTDYGLFVRLDATGSQGLLRLRDLGSSWHLDSELGELWQDATGRVLGLGKRLVVRIQSVDVLRGTVDLAPVGLRPEDAR